MKSRIVILAAIISFKSYAIYECEKVFQFNSKPRDYVEQVDSSLPGVFRYQNNVSKDGVRHYEVYERAEARGQVYGNILFKYDENSLTVEIGHIGLPNRNFNTAPILLAKVMSEFPYARRIQATLNPKDYALFADARNQGASVIEAIKMTSAYKMRQAIGFGRLKENSIHLNEDYKDLVFTTFRD